MKEVLSKFIFILFIKSLHVENGLFDCLFWFYVFLNSETLNFLTYALNKKNFPSISGLKITVLSMLTCREFKKFSLLVFNIFQLSTVEFWYGSIRVYNLCLCNIWQFSRAFLFATSQNHNIILTFNMAFTELGHKNRVDSCTAFGLVVY